MYTMYIAPLGLAIEASWPHSNRLEVTTAPMVGLSEQTTVAPFNFGNWRLCS
jgi:hypothetical protein